jgi:hypothetical protein
MPSHLLRCQGLAVDDYSFARGRLEAGTPSTFAQLRFKSRSPQGERQKNETFEKFLFTYSYELFDLSTGWLTKSRKLGLRASNSS